MEEELIFGMRRGETAPDGSVAWEWPGIAPGRDPKPEHYYPDGTPILGDELMPAFMKWAMLFEERDQNRIVGSTKTPYGERLSTIWLGLDHSWGHGPPLIYETMLFAPKTEKIKCVMDGVMVGNPEQISAMVERIERKYPHDQLQLRYSTRSEAEDSHEKLKMQCLIPPRWRHFIFWTIGRDRTWAHYNDGDEDDFAG